ncbi:hypothetical protein HDU97_003635 [Phlyctochytrium planicorne]|nr:hypothetical protein HDU97_003635 [Phlyctochytrium planicorne]
MATHPEQSAADMEVPTAAKDPSKAEESTSDAKPQEDDFEVSSIIAKLENKMGRKRATSSPTNSSEPQPQNASHAATSPSSNTATIPVHPNHLANRALTSPSLLNHAPQSQPRMSKFSASSRQASETSVDEGTKNFVKVNGKWVETITAKAFFMSASSVVDEEAMEDVQSVLKNQSVAETVPDTSTPKAKEMLNDSEKTLTKKSNDVVQAFDISSNALLAAAPKRQSDIQRSVKLEEARQEGEMQSKAQALPKSPAKLTPQEATPTVDTKSLFPTSTPAEKSSTKGEPRSVKKAIPDGDSLLAELDAALQEQQRFSSIPSATNPSASQKKDAEPWFSGMEPPKQTHQSHSRQQSPTAPEAPERVMAQFAAQCSNVVSGKTGGPTAKSSSMLSLDSSKPSRGTSVAARSPLGTTSQSGSTQALSPTTEQDIQNLANSIDKLIRSGKGSKTSLNEALSSENIQPIAFGDISVMIGKSSGSLLQLEKLNESEREDDSEDAFDEAPRLRSGNEAGLRPASKNPAHNRVTAKEGKKRSAIAWSAKSVAKSMRESFATNPGMEKIKSDLEALEMAEEEEEENDDEEDGDLDEVMEPQSGAANEPKLVPPLLTSISRTSQLPSATSATSASSATPLSTTSSIFSPLATPSKLPSARTRSSFENLLSSVETLIEIPVAINGTQCRFRIGDGKLHCIGGKSSGSNVGSDVDPFPFDFMKLLGCKEDGTKVVLTGVSTKKAKVTSVTLDFSDKASALKWAENIMRLVTNDALFKKGAIIVMDEREPSKVTKEAFQKYFLPVLQASGKEFNLHSIPFTAVALDKLFKEQMNFADVNAIVCISSRPKAKDVDEILWESGNKASGTRSG